jgi:hypothetical protein
MTAAAPRVPAPSNFLNLSGSQQALRRLAAIARKDPYPSAPSAGSLEDLRLTASFRDKSAVRQGARMLRKVRYETMRV